MQCLPHILIHAYGLICTPDKTARKEGNQKSNAIVKLCLGTGHVEFVKEPVEVQEWRREFVEDESTAIKVYEGSLKQGLAGNCNMSRFTYESKREDEESTERMGKHSKTKESDILECNDQVPEEVTSCHSLYHACCTSISPDALLPVHPLSVLIKEHHPQGEGVDQQTLAEGHHMDVPVNLPFGR